MYGSSPRVHGQTSRVDTTKRIRSQPNGPTRRTWMLFLTETFKSHNYIAVELLSSYLRDCSEAVELSWIWLGLNKVTNEVYLVLIELSIPVTPWIGLDWLELHDVQIPRSRPELLFYPIQIRCFDLKGNEKNSEPWTDKRNQVGTKLSSWTKTESAQPTPKPAGYKIKVIPNPNPSPNYVHSCPYTLPLLRKCVLALWHPCWSWHLQELTHRHVKLHTCPWGEHL